MHSFGLQSALAIRRQRKRKAELKRHIERRRLSSQSIESGIHGSKSTVTSPTGYNGSDGSLSHRQRRRKKPPKMLDTKVASSIGMLHVGVVFLVLGLFLIGSGVIPDDYVSWGSKNSLNNELIITGITSSIIGIFLLVLNHFINRKAESDLAAYVERQLTRTRSGRRLVPDAETGALHTKQQHRARQQGQIQQQNSPGSDLDQIAEEASGSEYRHIHQYNHSEIERKNSDKTHNVYNRELLVTRCYDTTET